MTTTSTTDYPSHHANAQAEYEPAPSARRDAAVKVTAARALPATAGILGVTVSRQGDVPRELGFDRAALAAAGFEGKHGQVLVLPRGTGPALVAVGVGAPGDLDVARLREAAAAFARVSTKHAHVAFALPEGTGLSPACAAQAIAEGLCLARYRYLALRKAPQHEPDLTEVTVAAPTGDQAQLDRGVARAGILCRAASLARDLGNAPATLLTARRMADIASRLAAECGLSIEIFDEAALLGMGCGGMLGVNAGSAEPPRLIKLTYRPRDAGGAEIEPSGRVSLIGKGIMFDSGGISLKPNDLVHATMKTDMSGAAAVLAAMTALPSIECKAAVTGYLMCTDNMPSGAAMKLGDVLTIRGGTTVEVQNTDAEGRLVMADGLVLATEERPRPDAVIDIATLTGACQRALGTQTAGVLGNHQVLIDRLIEAAGYADERLWQLPLDRRYRKELDSEIADMKNVGGENAGAITAALFLDEFVDGLPWAHIDIAGTARVDADETWRSKGATGFGARLLIEFLDAFTPPAQARH